MKKIEWNDKTWNCFTGCTKVSEGCDNSYAERMIRRSRTIQSIKDRISRLYWTVRDRFRSRSNQSQG